MIDTTYDPANFPWLSPVTSSWYLLRTYAVSRTNHFVPYRQTQLYNSGWNVLGVVNSQTTFNRYNSIISPILAKLPYKPYIAALSSLEPGTEILPHVGISNDVLRFHLGLVCPQPCGIRINGIDHTWHEGEWLIFNDMHEHSAWNKSDSVRIVFILDFYKSDLSID